LTCHHEGAARVMTFQPRDNIFECSTCNRASFVYCWAVSSRLKLKRFCMYDVCHFTAVAASQQRVHCGCWDAVLPTQFTLRPFSTVHVSFLYYCCILILNLGRSAICGCISITLVVFRKEKLYFHRVVFDS